MMKIIAMFALFMVSALAEPPVDNRYLPPNAQGGSVPSQTYGVPGSQFGGQRQTNAIFGGRPSSAYGTPHQRTNTRRPSTQYGAPTTQYGTPRSSMTSGFAVQTPSAQYGPPEIPSQLYGTPGQGDSFGSGQHSTLGAQSRQYLPPGRGGYSNDDVSNGEPANYNFEYMVKDEPSGNDFGHRESRHGDRAEGLYYVLLPDGRKQNLSRMVPLYYHIDLLEKLAKEGKAIPTIGRRVETVEYEADQNGYKPRISYEDVGSGFGSYGRGNQGGYPGGYPAQGPY